MPCKWIEYKDKKILYQDYRGLSKEEMLSTAEEAFENEDAAKEYLTS